MHVNLGVRPAKYPTGEQLSDVMRFNHYGSETIPPRPVLRIAAEKVIPRLKEIKGEEKKSAIETYFYNLLHQPSSQHKQLEREFLRKIGQAVAAEARNIIKTYSGDLRENAPATIKKKHFDKPLWGAGDEHIMMKNIDFEVTE